jgi:hypothetical protein
MSKDIEPLLDDYIVAISSEEFDIPICEQELIEKKIFEFLESVLNRVNQGFEDYINQTNAEDATSDHSEETTDIKGALLEELNKMKENEMQEISIFLDSRFTRFRRSYQTYRQKTLNRLCSARQSITEYKRAFETATFKSAENTVRVTISSAESKIDERIQDLQTNYLRFKSAYELTSSRNDHLEKDKVELLEKSTKLESRVGQLEDRASRVSPND